jgi:hypothetical protein
MESVFLFAKTDTLETLLLEPASLVLKDARNAYPETKTNVLYAKLDISYSLLTVLADLNVLKVSINVKNQENVKLAM